MKYLLVVILAAVAAVVWWFKGADTAVKTKITWSPTEQVTFHSTHVVTPIRVLPRHTKAPVATLLPTMNQRIVPSMPSHLPQPSRRVKAPDNDEADLLAYSVLLQRHFKKGLAQTDLQTLIKQTQKYNSQFILQPIYDRAFLKHNYITLSDKGSGLSFSDFEQQKQNFISRLQQCLPCNQVFVEDLSALMRVMQSRSPLDDAQRIIAKDAKIEERNAMFFAWIYGHFLPLYAPEDPRISWAMAQLRLSDNERFRQLAQQLLALLDNDLIRWLEIWLDNAEDPQLIEEWSMKLLQQEGYQTLWQFQNNHWQTLYTLNPEFTVSAIMFHAQYYSVSEARGALESLILINNEMANHAINHSLLSAQQHAQQPLARYWQSIQQQQAQSNIQPSWADQRNNQVSLSDWQQRFSALMSSPQIYKNGSTAVDSWQKQFSSAADGLNILEHHLALPSVLTYRTILMDAGVYITELEGAWNQNVTSLNQAEALHGVSTLSLNHWRYIARWSKEASASSLDEMVLYLYDYLLPVEQTKLKAIYQKKVKKGLISGNAAALSKWQVLQ